MQSMKHLHAVKLLAASALFSSQVVLASPQVRLVQELPKSETSRGLAAAGDYIFSGVSRAVEGESHHLAIFNAKDLSPKATLDLPHNVMQIIPQTETSVLVLGLVSEPYWQSKYSEVSWSTGKFVVKTKSIPVEVVPEQVTGTLGKLFFVEPGSAGVYASSGSKLSKFKGEVSGPGAMALSGDNLWVLSRGDLFHFGDERIAIGSVSTKTVKYSSVSPEDTRGLVDLKTVANGKFIVGTNIWKQRIVTFNPSTQEKVGEISFDQNPDSSSVFGSCVATIDGELKTVVVSKVNDDGSIIPVTSLDFYEAGDRLKSPRAIFFNGQHKQILVKSAYPCPSCTVSQSSVFAYEDSEATWWNECK